MKRYIIKMKLHSNSTQHVYWNKNDKGWVHKETESSLVDEQYIEWFKNSAYYDKKNTTIIPVEFSKHGI